MRRSLLLLLAVVATGGVVCYGSFRLAGHLCCARMERPTDDLDWLRLEFHLSPPELARIRQMHEGYLPQCKSYCDRIAAKKQELELILPAGTNAAPAVEQKLAEIAALRAQCQAAMLRHFAEVSGVMPPEQGHRYLAEMQRLTLGFHEQVEHSMSPHSAGSHGHP
jgi:hypothetical protein